MPIKHPKLALAISMALSISNSHAQFSAEFNLSNLNGNNGFVINGINVNDQTGISVKSAGDINNDGINDLIIGAPGADTNGKPSSGSSYVVFGSTTAFPNPFDLSNLNGANGFVINGAATSEQSGFSVSRAGDFNGDGINDLIIGAPTASVNTNSFAGKSYVVFGSNNAFPNPLNLSTLNGANGMVINGAGLADLSGSSVSAAGDVNGDGVDDLLIGAPNSSAGKSYVVFGNASVLIHPLNLTGINGANGFVINGVSAGDNTGTSVSTAGDINGDGIDDVIIGAKYADPSGRTDAGITYVVFGSNTGIPNPLNLSTLNGTNGFEIHGRISDSQSGISVSSAGDVNGDGFDDIIIGGYKDDSAFGDITTGRSYVVFGSNSGFPNPLNLLNGLNGSNGFSISGETSFTMTGRSVSQAGDINGDGIDDLIIGAPYCGFYCNSYVVFGKDTGFPASIGLFSLVGSNGFVIFGTDSVENTGRSVSAAGDINGDGYDDVIIGATNGNANTGSSYVIFGREHPIFANGFEPF